MHRDHHSGATAPGLAAPERHQETVDPQIATPTGKVGEAEDHGKNDTPIISDAALDGKAFATLRAQAALLGYALLEIGSGTFVITRWGWCRELPTLRAVGDMLRRIGGGQ